MKRTKSRFLLPSLKQADEIETTDEAVMEFELFQAGDPVD